MCSKLRPSARPHRSRQRMRGWERHSGCTTSTHEGKRGECQQSTTCAPTLICSRQETKSRAKPSRGQLGRRPYRPCRPHSFEPSFHYPMRSTAHKNKNTRCAVDNVRSNITMHFTRSRQPEGQIESPGSPLIAFAVRAHQFFFFFSHAPNQPIFHAPKAGSLVFFLTSNFKMRHGKSENQCKNYKNPLGARAKRIFGRSFDTRGQFWSHHKNVSQHAQRGSLRSTALWKLLCISRLCQDSRMSHRAKY